MERSLMKKFLIWTALVLAAITACNKEIDTQLTSNTPEEPTIEAKKVTLTIKASIEAETRTAYENDQKATWQVDDKITVCVTNSSHSDFLLYDLKAEIVNDELVFAGKVDENYTTVVSGIYPAQDNYHLDTPVENTNKKYFNIGAEGDGTVIGIYLPDTYDLETANDTGRYIPMVGEMVHDNDNNTDTFTFHHICGALKITVVDIFNALTFTTSGEKITGSFPLTSDGRITMSEGGSGSTVTFNYGRLPREEGYVGERENRTFYIPVPFGTVTAGATMALKSSNDKVVFEKTTSGNITFDSKVIKRLSKLELTKPAGWYVSLDMSGSSPKLTYTVPGNQLYIRTWTTKETFDRDFHGSIAEWLEKRVQSSSNTTFSSSSTKTVEKTVDQYLDESSPKVYLMVGVDNTDYKVRKTNLNFCKVEVLPELPSDDYNRWIGTWEVLDSQTSPKKNNWTISSRLPNHTYNIKGIGSATAIICEAQFNSNTGNLVIQSQENIWIINNSEGDRIISLYGRTGSTFNRGVYDIMSAQFNDDTYTSATLNSFGNFDSYCLPFYVNGELVTGTSYGIRYLPSSMTRVTETE